MRNIKSSCITDAIERLFLEACCNLGADVIVALENARAAEQSETGKDILDQLLANAKLAQAESSADPAKNR